MSLDAANGFDSGTEFVIDSPIAPADYSPSPAPSAPPAAAAPSAPSAPSAPATQAAPPASPMASAPAAAPAANPALRPSPAQHGAPPTSAVAGQGQPAPVAPSPVRDYLRQQGINPEAFHDDQSALGYMLQTIRQQQQQLDAARYYAQQAPVPQQQATPVAAQPSPASEPGWKKLWPSVEWRDEWSNDVHYNTQTGRYEPNHQYVHPHIVHAANERQAVRKANLDRLLSNPFELLWEGNQERLEQMFAEREQQILERVEQVFANQHQNQFIVDTVNQAKSWMYATDASGNAIYDPHPSGQAFPRLSEAGMRYVNAVRQLRDGGITDPKTQHAFAMQMIGGAPQPQAQPAAPQPAPLSPADQRRENFLNRGRALPPGTASMGPSTTGTHTNWNDPHSPAQNPMLDLGAMFDQTMRERGMLPAVG